MRLNADILPKVGWKDLFPEPVQLYVLELASGLAASGYRWSFEKQYRSRGSHGGRFYESYVLFEVAGSMLGSEIEFLHWRCDILVYREGRYSNILKSRKGTGLAETMEAAWLEAYQNMKLSTLEESLMRI